MNAAPQADIPEPDNRFQDAPPSALIARASSGTAAFTRQRPFPSWHLAAMGRGRDGASGRRRRRSHECVQPSRAP